MKFQDLSGKKFDRLLVIERAPNDGRRTMWKCKCDCGNYINVRAENLKSGNTRSCGCIASELHSRRLYKHGFSDTRLAHIFNQMKYRCYNPNCYEYNIYGGRGIKICDEWLNNPATFYQWAVTNGYQEDLSIDRIDTNLGYSPKNCRWVDSYVQANNTRKNIYYDYHGERHTLKEWSRIIGINYSTLYNRVRIKNWGIEEAFNPRKRINQYI